MLSMIFGFIGLGYFVYGRKQQKGMPMAIGILLGVFPYVMPDATLMLLFGLALTAVPFFFRD